MFVHDVGAVNPHVREPPRPPGCPGLTALTATATAYDWMAAVPQRPAAPEASGPQTPATGAELRKQSLKVGVGVPSAHPTRRARYIHRNEPRSARGLPAN
jgi:hypothetical protein